MNFLRLSNGEDATYGQDVDAIDPREDWPEVEAFCYNAAVMSHAEDEADSEGATIFARVWDTHRNAELAAKVTGWDWTQADARAYDASLA